MPIKMKNKYSLSYIFASFLATQVLYAAETSNVAPTFYHPPQIGAAIVDIAGQNDQANALVMGEEGSSYLVGSSIVNNNSDIAVIKLNKRGRLDKKFGNTTPKTGKSIIPVGKLAEQAWDVVRDRKGALYVVGQRVHTIRSGVPRNRVVVLKLTKDGELDKNFGNTTPKTGKSVFTLANSEYHDFGIRLVLDKTGSIYVAGQSYIPEEFDYDFFALKITPEGTIDKSFGEDGVSFVATGKLVNDQTTGIALDSKNRLYLSGYRKPYKKLQDFAVLRLDSNGKLDKTFGNKKTGMQIISVGNGADFATRLAIDKKDRIYVSGYSANEIEDLPKFSFSIMRLNSNGALDKSFGNTTPKTGKSMFKLGDYSDYSYGLTVKDDAIYLSGFSEGVYDKKIAVIKLDLNGTLSKGFGEKSNGVALVDFGEDSDDNKIHDIELDYQGNILLSGAHGVEFQNDFFAVRLSPKGKLDPSYGNYDKKSIPSTVDSDVVYIKGSDGVTLDSTVTLFDQNLYELNDFLGDYGGAKLNIRRKGGRNVNDKFLGTDRLKFKDSVELDGKEIASYIQGEGQSGGELSITFYSGVTQKEVNTVASSIAYKNDEETVSEEKPTVIELEWIFSDGNKGGQGVGGSLTATAFNKVTILNEGKSMPFKDSFEL